MHGSNSRRPGGPIRRSGVFGSGKRAWRRVVRNGRDQGCSNEGFRGKTGVKVTAAGPDRSEKDRLPVHETAAVGLGPAVGDEPELVRFSHRKGTGPMAVTRGFELSQAFARAAADAPMSRAYRRCRRALRFWNHPEHGAGGQDEKEDGAGQGFHGISVRRTEPGRNSGEGAPLVRPLFWLVERWFSRAGPSEQSREGWRAVPSSGFLPGRSVPPSRRWPPPPRPTGRGRLPIARGAHRSRRAWRASPRH